MSLSQIWNDIKIRFSTSHMFGGPTREIRQELEKLGWKFTDQVYIGSAIFPVSAVVTTVRTPEGKFAEPGSFEYERYRQARREAALRLQGPKIS